LQKRTPAVSPTLDWSDLTRVGGGLFLWEAFVTDRAKAAKHVYDATVAVAAFREVLPDPTAANAVTAEHPRLSDGAPLERLGRRRPASSRSVPGHQGRAAGVR
jgi:hypothetical protein